jgi:hypothetical protein
MKVNEELKSQDRHLICNDETENDHKKRNKINLKRNSTGAHVCHRNPLGKLLSKILEV